MCNSDLNYFFQQLISSLILFAESKRQPPTYFMIKYENKEALMSNGRIYRKRLGRAFRSYWICVEKGCQGQIMVSELKGGSMQIVEKHVSECVQRTITRC